MNWQIPSEPFTALAPMQEITDLAFWRTMLQCGGGSDLYVTEYFRVHVHSNLEKHILGSILESPTKRPVLAQLIGQDEVEVRRTARELLEYEEVAGIDLNLGCPAPVVCSKNAGGGLLRNLEHVDRLLGALREECGGRLFTVKTRLGFEEADECEELLEVFTRHDLDLLSVHGRTVKDRYQTPVHDEMVAKVVAAMPCPVLANGNVVDVATGLAYWKKTGAAGLMIGRGAIRNPWLFSQMAAAWSGGELEPVIRRQLLEYIEILWEETARTRLLFKRDFHEGKHVQKMKRYLNYIISGLNEEVEFRVKRVREKGELFALLRDALDNEEPMPALPPECSKLFCRFSLLLE